MVQLMIDLLLSFSRGLAKWYTKSKIMLMEHCRVKRQTSETKDFELRIAIRYSLAIRDQEMFQC